MRRFRLFGSVLGLLFAMTLPSRADVIIGAFDGVPNCYPFGNCGYTGEYQQVYGGFAFAGISQIVGLGFATAVTDNLPVTLAMQIALSTTTTADPNFMSTNYADNIGPDNTT